MPLKRNSTLVFSFDGNLRFHFSPLTIFSIPYCIPVTVKLVNLSSFNGNICPALNLTVEPVLEIIHVFSKRTRTTFIRFSHTDQLTGLKYCTDEQTYQAVPQFPSISDSIRQSETNEQI